MPVHNWMTANVVSVEPETSVLKIGRLMKEHNVRRIPVVDGKRHVVGIISDRDVRDASPSKATTLDMYELHYLLAKLKARDIMTPNPITVKASETVENAALIMLEKKIGGLPVIDESGQLEGIISDQDVFAALVDITGARLGGLQFAIEIPDQPGTARPLFDTLRAHGARLLSVLTVCNPDGNRHLFIRVRRLASEDDENSMMEDVKKIGKILYLLVED